MVEILVAVAVGVIVVRNEKRREEVKLGGK